MKVTLREREVLGGRYETASRMPPQFHVGLRGGYVDTFTRTVHHIVHLRSVHFIVCTLYLQKQHHTSQVKCL